MTNETEYIRVKDGVLEIRMPLSAGVRSASGKTLVVASTRGNIVATGEHNGKAVIVGLNAYIKG